MKFDVEQSLGFIVARTSARMRNHLAKALKPYNVTTEQWALLVRLWQQDGISQKELADKTQKDQPTITRILDKLEQRGLIARQSNPNDRREYLICLRPEGWEIRASLEKAALEVLHDAVRGMTEQDQDRLKKLLNRVTANLD